MGRLLVLRFHTNHHRLLHSRCCALNGVTNDVRKLPSTSSSSSFKNHNWPFSSQSLSSQFLFQVPHQKHLHCFCSPPSIEKKFFLPCNSTRRRLTTNQTQVRASTKPHPAEQEERLTERKNKRPMTKMDPNLKLVVSASVQDLDSDTKETSLNFDQSRHPSDLLKLEGVDWRLNERYDWKELFNNWLKLSKFRLTSLVVLTTLAGYYMGFTHFDPTLVACALVGTALTSSSAAALNQFLEVPYDSQMIRTKNRPIVMKQVSPLHSFTFSLVSGVTGISLLAAAVNPLTAALGALNLVLYSFVYTPMKRVNILNTWVGSVVGAIPPIMGYTAATGSINLAAINLGLILYSWQFPHFNALSWNIKNDYARAGYRMMVVTHPELCVRTAFRHSVFLLLYCELMCSSYVGLTTWTYGFDTLPINLYLIYLTYRFKKNPNSSTSRTLFKYSLVHLPFLIVLMLMSKKAQKEKQKETPEVVN